MTLSNHRDFFQITVPYTLLQIFYSLTLQDSTGSVDGFDIQEEKKREGKRRSEGGETDTQINT